MDAAYMFINCDTAPSLDRSPVNGFRCMRYCRVKSPWQPLKRSLRSIATTARKSLLQTEASKVTRVCGSDKGPLHARIESTSHRLTRFIRRITFDAAYGKDRAIAHLYLPLRGDTALSNCLLSGGNYLEKRAFPQETASRGRLFRPERSWPLAGRQGNL